jgi:hypothetical protein
MFERAQSGDSGMKAIFLPSSIHPERDDAWHEARRAEFLTDEEFFQEYPETVEQALAGQQGAKVYDPAGINAAEALGRTFDELLAKGEMPPPDGGTLRLGIDWGEMTHMLCLWPLEGGGVYVAPGEVAPQKAPLEPGSATRVLMENLLRLGVQRVEERDEDGRPTRIEPLLGVSSFDAAGVQSERTHLALLEGGSHARTRETPEPREDGLPFRAQWDVQRVGGRTIVPPGSVPFNRFKDETKNYLKRLFVRTAEGREAGVIAISPQNRVLLRQLRGLELVDDGSGRIAKNEDHGPDALIAGTAMLAKRFRDRVRALTS